MIGHTCKSSTGETVAAQDHPVSHCQTKEGAMSHPCISTKSSEPEWKRYLVSPKAFCKGEYLRSAWRNISCVFVHKFKNSSAKPASNSSKLWSLFPSFRTIQLGSTLATTQAQNKSPIKTSSCSPKTLLGARAAYKNKDSKVRGSWVSGLFQSWWCITAMALQVLNKNMLANGSN